MTYKKTLILYYDILGFSEFVFNSEYNTVLEVMRCFKNYSEKDLDDLIPNEFIQLSDTAIKIMDMERVKESIELSINSIFYNELVNAAYIIHDLLHHNILTRGVLLYDKIYSSKSFCFGPGLINAYRLEKEGKYPRLVFDQNFIHMLNLNEFNEPILSNNEKKYLYGLLKSKGGLDEEKEKIKKYIKYDSDGEYFLDYMLLLESTFEQPEVFNSFLIKQCKIIQNGMERYQEFPDILSKYKWLKKYHNETLDSLVYKPNREDLYNYYYA